MALLNANYLKLAGGYLFPEIARRVEAFVADDPARRELLVHCGIGDVTEPLPEAVREAMHRAVDEMGRHETFRGYGDYQGEAFLREAIAEGDFRSRGVAVDPDEIFISDGSKTDCGALLDILASGGANRVGITDPVYPVYVDTNVMAGNAGVATGKGSYEGLTYLPCTAANDFVPEIPAEPLDVIYLCYPNNPTGGMIDRARLAEWVEYALRHDALILFDVAYQAFIRDDDLPRSIYEIGGARSCAVELHSFSKNAGFTGVRCGYTVCPRELLARTQGDEKVPLHGLWKRRWNTKANGVCYIVQRGAEAVYADPGRLQVQSLIDHYMTNADLLRDGCEALGLDVHGGRNAPYVWVACPGGRGSWETFDLLLERAHVVTTPGAGFGGCGEGYFRISAFNSRGNVEEVVKRLKVAFGSDQATKRRSGEGIGARRP